MSVLISVIVRNVQLIAGQCHRSVPNEAASHQALYSGQRQSAVPISGLLPTSCMWLNVASVSGVSKLRRYEEERRRS